MIGATVTAGAMRAREAARSRLLSAYIGAGLLFMLLPGTFLGVWNLFQVSARESVGLVSPAWLQAHGHAQVFGWVGSFILGIGFYAIPRLRGGSRLSIGPAWACWGLWTTGVSMRWAANVYGWHWRVLLPMSAALELVAFLIFLRGVLHHRSAVSAAPWVRVVMTACAGLATTLLLNAGLTAYLAWRGESPVVPHGINQRFLTVVTWGFLAPFVWGFSTKWLPVLLGLRPTHVGLLAAGIVLNVSGVLLTLAGWGAGATGLFVAAAAAVAAALRIFERPIQPARTRGVHASFPIFVRLAYAWLLVAALLGGAAAISDTSGGIWGASRHAFTVGFVSVMVFSIGQRVLPAFAGARPLWSPRLMLAGLALLSAGCLLRTSSEVLAYQQYADWAWSVLPVSAIVELAAATTFAVNMAMTFLVEPRRQAGIGFAGAQETI